MNLKLTNDGIVAERQKFLNFLVIDADIHILMEEIFQAKAQTFGNKFHMFKTMMNQFLNILN